MKILRLISFLVLWVSVCTTAVGQDTSAQSAEAFIIKVMSEYKNPMAYYPLRKDIFLPTDQELQRIELKNSYPEGSVVLDSFIFIKDKPYEREPFVDSRGNQMFEHYLQKPKLLSVKGNSEYFRSKQNRLLRANPNLGKFLLYNSDFKTAKN